MENHFHWQKIQRPQTLYGSSSYVRSSFIVILLCYSFFLFIISDDTTTAPTITKVGLEEEVDAPKKKKKKKSKAAELEKHVVPVRTLLELDNEISAYKGCSDSSCFQDCRGGCFGKILLKN